MSVALVTGSAKGIGKAIALELANTGFDIVVHYRSSVTEAQTVCVEASLLGVKAIALQADITNELEVQTLIKETQEQLGSLDVLVNNVGDYHKETIAKVSSKDWHYMLDSNLNAVFYSCQAALPMMRERTWGRIINIGFAGAEQLIARPETTAYGIAKTGVILYSKALAKTEAEYGITINVISPGVMDNSVTKPIHEIPMGRTGKMQELTSAVRYLVSNDASYITGVTLEVAGGWHL